MFTRLPLDRLSSIVLVANAEPTDVIEVHGPFGGAYSAKFSPVLDRPPVIRPAAAAHRTYCKPHLLLMLFRKRNAHFMIIPRELDFVQEAIAADDLEEMVRRGEIKVFGVVRHNNATWHTCPHCRWKERNLERLRQA